MFYCYFNLFERSADTDRARGLGALEAFDRPFDACARVRLLCATPCARRGSLACTKEQARIVFHGCSKVPDLQRILLRYFRSPESCLMDVDQKIVKKAEENDTVEVDFNLSFAEL